MDGYCKAKLAAGTVVEIEAGVSLFTDPISDENGMWRRRSNFELYQSYKASDIINFIKIPRIKWAGHVIRMSEDRTTKKSVLIAQPNEQAKS
ncbi:hypothetical protein TNCV_3548611 [Trichonephila clavipes]|nr:hypothetical protein TNCV_3548611 [Trichonephila clavipes]